MDETILENIRALYFKKESIETIKKFYLKEYKKTKKTHKDWNDKFIEIKTYAIIKEKSEDFNYKKSIERQYDLDKRNSYLEYLKLRKDEKYKIEKNEKIISFSEIKKLGYSKEEFDKLFKKKTDFHESKEYKIRKKEIKERDFNKCLFCLFSWNHWKSNITGVYRIFDQPEVILDPYNLVYICTQCYDKRYGKNHWDDYDFGNPLGLFKDVIYMEKSIDDLLKKIDKETLFNIISGIKEFVLSFIRICELEREIKYKIKSNEDIEFDQKWLEKTKKESLEKTLKFRLDKLNIDIVENIMDLLHKNDYRRGWHWYKEWKKNKQEWYEKWMKKKKN